MRPRREERRTDREKRSQHLKHEDPDFSPAFQGVVRRMSEYFDVDVFATRLNFYRDGADWKPFHHDSHAFANGQKEDFTMGASFGAARDLAFLHEPSGQRFSFPQNNGDVFAFTSSVNRAFKHGVPKARRTNIGPRFSIIAWGRRRTINGRNGGRAGVVEDNAMAGDGGTRPFGGGRKVGGGGRHARPPHPSGLLDGGEREASRNERVLAGADVSDLVADLVLKEEGAGRAGAKTKTAGGGRGRAGAGKRPKPVRALRGRLGEDRFQELKALGRRFQRGHVGARELYETALGLLDGDAGALMGLVDSLPGEQKRAEVGEWHRTRAEWA